MERPESEYSRSLLRRVRIEMPRMLAACVRLPRQWSSVSRIRSRSTSATVRPTRPRVTATALFTAACTGAESPADDGALVTWLPSGRRIASGWMSGPVQAAVNNAVAVTRGLVGRTVADVERDLILDTLDHCLGNRTHAANILGISIRTLRNKLREYSQSGLAVPPPGEQRLAG